MKKYYLYYNKNTNLRVDIKETNESKQFNYITIDETEYREIMNGLNNKMICKVKNGNYYLEKNETFLRQDLKDVQDNLFNEMLKFFDPVYQEVLELTEDDKNDLNKYKLDVSNILKSFDGSYKKQEFVLIFVDNSNFENILDEEISEHKIFKPLFVK